MRSDTLRLLLSQIARFLLLVALPFAAAAAEQSIQKQTGVASIAALTWTFVWAFSTGGWAIMHLDTLVDWFAPTDNLSWEQMKGIWKSRLTIVKNYIASVSAGVGFYMIAVSVPQWFGLSSNLPEMVVLVGVVPAAMGGTITWDKFRKRFMPGE